MNKLLNAFTYPATIAQIDSFKTLKQKEALARELSSKIGRYHTNYLNTDYILTYKAYCYLLDKHYPNHQEKLPQFITKSKDRATVDIFKTYMNAFIEGETVNIDDVLSTFEFTTTVYYSIYNENQFMYLNLLFYSNKLAGNLVLELNNVNYYNYYNKILYKIKTLKINKDTDLKHIVYNQDIANLPITVIQPYGYGLNYYTIKEGTHKGLTSQVISMYLYLSTCNILPNRDKIDYYWNTLAQSFIDVLGTKPLNEMLEVFKQSINSTKYYIRK